MYVHAQIGRVASEPMPGEFFFMALRGLGVSLAGFAGLIATFDRRAGSGDPIPTWRIRGIRLPWIRCRHRGIWNGCGPYPHRERGGNGQDRQPLFDADVLCPAAGGSTRSRLAHDRQRRLVVVSSAFVVALIVLNLVLASVGLLQLMLLVWLSGAMGIFMNAVREIGVASEPALRDNENDDRRFGSE
jgi:hypothetical protein